LYLTDAPKFNSLLILALTLVLSSTLADPPTSTLLIGAALAKSF
jgi:hypothetical protein